MQTFDSLFERELKRIVAQEIDRLRGELERNTYEKIEQFRYVMGQIAAWRKIEEFTDEAKEAAQQRNR